MADNHDGRYFYDWNTAGRASANDYRVEVRLSDGTRADSRRPAAFPRCHGDVSCTPGHRGADITITLPITTPEALAWAGADLWVSNDSGWPDKVHKVNPATGQSIISWNVPSTADDGEVNDMVWDGTGLWLTNPWLNSPPRITRHTTSGTKDRDWVFPGTYTCRYRLGRGEPVDR